MRTKLLAALTAGAALAFVLAGATPASAAPPANDDFDSAVEITQVPFEHSIITTEATVAEDDPLCYDVAERTAWYRYAPTSDGRIDFSTAGSNYRTTLDVFTGTRGSLEIAQCGDPYSGRASVRMPVTAGTTYYIMVGTNGVGKRGNLKLTVTVPQPPVNDTVKGATPVEEIPTSLTTDAREATSDTNDPECFSAHPLTVWYSYKSSGDVKLKASAHGYSTPTLGIFERLRSGRLEKVACLERGYAGAILNAEARGKYLFGIGSSIPQSVTFQLDPAPITVRTRLRINHFGSINTTTGIAKISGTLECNEATDVYLSGSLRQAHGSRVTVASFSKSVDCEAGKKFAWNARLEATKRAFLIGPAGATVKANPEVRGKSKSKFETVELRP